MLCLALCDRHYKSIPRKPTSPRCSPFHCVQYADSQPCPQSSNTLPDTETISSEDGQSSRESVPSEPSADDDSCYEDDEQADPKSTMKFHLRELLKEAKIKRAWCRKPIEEMTVKNQKAKGRTIIEIFQIVVGLLTNTVEEYSQVMSLVIELLAGKTKHEDNVILDAMMHAVSEHFGRLVKYVEKLQLLSIFANHIKYHKMAEYIPNLSERMWHEAKIRARSPAKSMPDVRIRERYDTTKIELFISFITRYFYSKNVAVKHLFPSVHLMVGLPWGEQKTRDSTGKIVILPNTIRLTGIYESIAMYEE